MRKRDIVEKAAKYIKGHRREHRRHYFLRGVSAIVVFCTVYSLILPAISMEQKHYCGLAEHKHSEACYKSELVCGYTEDALAETLSATVAAEETLPDATVAGETTASAQAHVHTDACYEQKLICEKTEHTHTLICYADPNADVESADVWARSVSGVTLSGNWAEDLVAIAESQLGYRESEKNYQVADDGVTIKGYTRYGDWSGDRYGDWNAMFLAFCLNYANIPESAFPRETNSSRWVRALTQRGLYHVSDYEPNQGDLVFFDRDDDGTSDHVALITETKKDKNDHVTQLSTVEGDSSNCVQRGSYSMDESTISGFAALPENPNVLAEIIPVETVPTVEVTKPETTAPIHAEAELPVESVRPSVDIQAEGDPVPELMLNYVVDVEAGVMIPFTPTYTHEYVFESRDIRDTYGYLYDADGKQLACDDESAGNRQFRITYTLTEGTLYYYKAIFCQQTMTGKIPLYIRLGAHQYTEGDAGYIVCVCGASALTGLALDTPMNVDVAAGKTVMIQFTPEYTHEYVFESTFTTYTDTYGYLYDAGGKQLTSARYGGNNGNFKFSYTLTAETTYYFGVSYYSYSDSGTIPVLLTPGEKHNFQKNNEGDFVCGCGERALTGLALDTQMNVDVAAGETVMIQFTPTYTHEYVFQSTGSGDTYGYLYDASGKELKHDDDGAGSNQFKIAYDLEAGTPYLFGVKYVSSSKSGTIPVLLTLGEKHNFQKNDAGAYACGCGLKALTGLEQDKPMDVDVARGETILVQYTPTLTHEYVFESTFREYADYTDTYGYLYDTSGNQLAYDDDSGDYRQLKVTYDLTAGTTYLFGVKYKGDLFSGTIPVLLTLGKTHKYQKNNAGEYVCSCGKKALTGLALDTPMDVDVAADETVMLPFTPTYTHEYVFESTGGTWETLGRLYDASGEQILYNVNGAGNGNFRITYSLTAGTTYFFGVDYSQTDKFGTIPVLLTLGETHYYKEKDAGVFACACGLEASTVSGLELDTQMNVSVPAGKTVLIPFTPTYTHEFVFNATSEGCHTYLYDTSGMPLVSQEGTITYTLVGGKNYYYAVRYTDGTASGTIPVLLTWGAHSYSMTQVGDYTCSCGVTITGLELDKKLNIKVALRKTVKISFTPEFGHDYLLTGLSDKLVTISMGGTSTTNTNPRLSVWLDGGTTYTIEIKFYDAVAGTIPVVLSFGKHNYVENDTGDFVCTCGRKMRSPELDTQMDVMVNAGEEVRIPFRPSYTHEYVFESKFTDNTNPVGYLYNAGGENLYSDYFSGDNNNFKITYTLTGGELYYFGVEYYSSSNSGMVPLLLTLGAHQYTENDEGNLACVCGEVIREENGLEPEMPVNVTLAEKEIVKFPFTPTFSHQFVFESTGTEDTLGYLYDSNGTLLKSDDDSGGNGQFKITYDLSADATYYFEVKYKSGTASGTIPVQLTFGPKHTSYEFKDSNFVCVVCGSRMPSVELDTPMDVEVEKGKTVEVSFTPEFTHEYVFESTCTGYADTCGYLYSYDASGKRTQLKADDQSGDSNNFRISYTLNAGTLYTFVVKYCSNTVSGTIPVLLTLGTTHQYNIINEAGDFACTCGKTIRVLSGLKLDTQMSAEVAAGESVRVKFTPEVTHQYVFESAGSEDTYGYLYDASGKRLTYDDNSGENGQFRISYKLIAGKTYYYGAKYVSSAASGTIPMLLTLGTHNYESNGAGDFVCVCGAVQEISDLALNTQMDVDIAAGQTVRFRFTPEYTHSYFFDVHSGYAAVYLYDASGTEIGGGNTDLTRDLTAGTTYYFGVKYFSSARFGPVPVTFALGDHKFKENSAGVFACTCGVDLPNGLQLKERVYVEVAANETVKIPFMPQFTHSYKLSISGIGKDYCLTYVFDVDGNKIHAVQSNSITANLNGGATYYYGAKYTRETPVTIGFYVELGAHVYKETEPGVLICVCGAQAPNSGKCGENATWTYANGVLTISGTGTMTSSPWRTNLAKLIKSVVIEDGVTSIASNAFKDCEYLTSATIPDSVTSIGELAFYSCSSLTSVAIPNGVASIEESTFGNCDSLTSVTIPGSVATIGTNAFQSCGSLASVNMLDGVKSIGETAFYSCVSLTSVTIPSSVTTIGQRAFDSCVSLTDFNIPDGVTSIGEKVFYRCTSLKSVTIPDSATIGDGMFNGCTSLKSVTIPDSVTTIGDEMFYRCTSLTDVNIPDCVTSIGVAAFYQCSSLKSVTIPDSVTTIGGSAFRGCSSLRSLTIPENVTSIGGGIFADCRRVETLYWNAKGPVDIKSQGASGGYSDGRLFTFVIGNSVDVLTSNNLSVFADMRAGKIEFERPNYITMSGLNADFTDMPLSTLPESRYYIDESGIFYRISEGKAYVAYYPAEVVNTTIPATIPAEDASASIPVVGVDSYAFKQATISELTFAAPKSITVLANFAFYGAKNLASIDGQSTAAGVLSNLGSLNPGGQLFGGTKISCGDITSEILTMEKYHLDLKLETSPCDKHTPANGEDGSFLYYTGEAASTTVTISNPIGSNADSDIVIRIYLRFDTQKFSLNYKLGQHYDLVSNITDKHYGLDVIAADIPNCYYLEMERPDEGDTVSFILTSLYPSPTSGGGFATVWGTILSADEKTLVGNGVSLADGSHLLKWETVPNDFTLTQEGGDNLAMHGDGNGGAFVEGFSYSIHMAREGSTLEGIGKDYVNYVVFEDTFTLSDGAALSEEVISAIRNDTYLRKWDKDNSIYRYYTPDGYEFLTTKIVFTDLDVNDQGQLLLRWVTENSDKKTEISALNYYFLLHEEAVVIPDPQMEKNYTFTNHVKLTLNYMFSGNRVKEVEASGEVVISEGSLELIKTPRKQTDATIQGVTIGSSQTFKICARNPGVMPYTRLASLEDELPHWFYLSAEQLAALFAGDTEHDLASVTISSATICAPIVEKEVTLIDGLSLAVTDLSNTGEHTTHSGMTYNDPDRLRNDAVITLAWAGPDQIQIALDDGTTRSCAPTAEAIQDVLDGFGFLVTYDCVYKLVWDLTDEVGNALTLIGGEVVEKSFDATFKDTFMLLDADKYNYYWPSYSGIYTVNTVYAYDINKEQLGVADTIEFSLDRDYELYLGWSWGGQTIDEASQMGQGSVLDYDLTVKHHGSGRRDLLPLVNHMSGAQALLVPKALNSEMVGAEDCRTVMLGETEYYLLLKEGTYSHVWTSENQMAESVTVTKTASGFDTLITWYFADYSGDRTDSVPYKAMVCPNDAVPGHMVYRLDTEAWLNDHQPHRLYDDIGWAGVNLRFDKKIVKSVGDTETGTIYSLVHEGEDIVYRLTLHSNTDGDGNLLTTTLTGDAIKDFLPGSVADYRWTKDNIKIVYGDGCNVVNGNSWEVADQTSDAQRIIWNPEFSITFTGTAYIYVTLTFPSDLKWQSYATKYGAQVLINTFRVYSNESSVTHELALPGCVRLQKGVYSTGKGTTPNLKMSGRRDARFHYANSGGDFYGVSYYVTLENGGLGKLYLTELWDRQPRGFSVYLAETYVAYEGMWWQGAVVPVDVYSASGAKMKKLRANDNVVIVKTEDGRQITRTYFNNGSYGHLHYDAGRDMYYLNPGECLVLNYFCNTNGYYQTDDVARNIVSMPYYDYTGMGVTVDTGSRTVVKKAATYVPNDGDCYLETNGQALSHGFEGGTTDTKWLTSDVTVTREEIKPGITKSLKSATNAFGEVVQNPVSVHSMDTLKWQIKAENDSSNRILDYTLTDVMQSPYMFTGRVDFQAEDYEGFSFTIKETDNPDQLLIKHNSYNSLLTIGGDPVELDGINYDPWLSISRNADGNAVLSLRILDDSYSIPPFGSVTLTLTTKNTTTDVVNKQFINTCFITPMSQTWNNTTNKGNMTELETPFSDAVLPSVRNSAPVTTAYGYMTTSIKRVEEVGNPSNFATSVSDPSYIVLDSVGSQFAYTISVDNSTPKAMDKLIMIDSLPEVGDHTVFQNDDPRFSAFKVSLADVPNFYVTVKDDDTGTTETLDPGRYKLEFSTKTEFDANDWNGTSTWSTSKSGARSIRFVLLSGTIPAKSTVSLHFTCKVDGNADPGAIAWNSFGYHYKVVGASVDLEAAPLKVGVKVPGVPKLKKQIVDYAGYDIPAEKDDTFSFLLYEGAALTGTYETEAALTKALTDAGIAYRKVTLTVRAGQTCSEAISLRTTGWEWTAGKTWTHGQTYTLVELPIAEREYKFRGFDVTGNPSYSFVYNRAVDKVITCENTYLRWDAELTKVNSLKEPLAGAVFAFYSPNSADKMTTSVPAEYTDLSVETEIVRNDKRWYLKAIDTTPENGKLSWNDLFEEEYYLVEVKAPDGYNQPTGDGWLLECKNVERGVCKITVTNTSSHELPMTGGSGTTLYTAGGALLMACAGMLLLYSKKKRRKEEIASS